MLTYALQAKARGLFGADAGAEEEEEEEDEDRQSCAEFLGGGLGRRRRVALRPKGKKNGEHECECKSVCSWAKAMAQQHPPLAQREGRRDAAAAVAYRARAAAAQDAKETGIQLPLRTEIFPCELKHFSACQLNALGPLSF